MRRALFFIAMCVIVAQAVHPAAAADAKQPWKPEVLWKLKGVSDPQLSPDGRWIAYVVSVTDFDENRRNSDIWMVPTDGGEPRRMTTSEKGDSSPRWSPDGQRIAFISSRSGSAQIHLIPFSGGEAVKMTDFPGGIGDFMWTVDGDGFIFTGRVYSDCEDLDCVRERDEEKEKKKVSAMVHESLLYRHWSTYDDGKAQHLFHVSDEGGEPRDLTPDLEFDALTYWLASAGREFDLSPDGKTLYFAGKQDPDQAVSYNEEIWAVSVDSRNE